MVTIRKKDIPCGSGSAPCACSGSALEPHTLGRLAVHWCDGVVPTVIGDVPRVPARLSSRDRLETIRTRFAIGRMSYRVPPGVYAVGMPIETSPVLVTANFKLSFDHLRRELSGRHAWILVLDTHGINVWCAAGKGTFGTDELARRVQLSGLERIVTHRKLIVPQLGATGVCAHRVKALCGFRVIYGPVRAADLPAFLDADLKATPSMRRVRFKLRDRLVLIPVETVMGAQYAFLAAAILLLLSGVGQHGYSLAAVRATGLTSAALALGTYLGGTTLGPMLLPWLPGRAFALKGAVLGLALFGTMALWGGLWSPGWHTVAWALFMPAITSFVVMNFTGASTFTSLSGVLREMRIAVPAQIVSVVIGLGLWVTGLFQSGGWKP